MLNQLLETIIQILTGWLDKFTSHSQHVEDKLDSLDQTASDIETNTDPIPEIRDNTAAVITPIQNIKSNTDSIKTSSQTSANNTTAILNNVGTLSTNTGRAAAFAEDCANNTLDIKDKVTTIASDTTQIRAVSSNIAADVSSINQAIGYYIANTLVTEDSEGSICNFDTDLEDYLQKAICTIPADGNGFSSIKIVKTGINLLDMVTDRSDITNNIRFGYTSGILLKSGTYTLSISEQVSGIYIYDFNTNTAIVTKYNSDFVTFTINTDILVKIDTYKIGINHDDIYSLAVGSQIVPYEDYKSIVDIVSLGSTITDGAEIDLLSGIVKINTSPVTYSSITPIAVRTYKGVNNIYSDIGSTALTYRETLKHYLAKNNQ